MNAVIQTLRSLYESFIHTLRSLYESFLNLPHHRLIYAAVATVAVLLIAIPLLRLLFGSRAGDEQTAPVEAGYPSMFGLASAPAAVRPAPLDFAPAPPSFAPAPPSNVTPINESLTVPCTHCGVIMSPRQDFCPACGYAQPMKQSFTA